MNVFLFNLLDFRNHILIFLNQIRVGFLQFTDFPGQSFDIIAQVGQIILSPVNIALGFIFF